MLGSVPRFQRETGSVCLPLLQSILRVTGFLCVGTERPLLPVSTVLQPSHFCARGMKKFGVVVPGGTEIAVLFYQVLLQPRLPK